MAIDDNYGMEDLSDLISDDFAASSSSPSPSSNGFHESQLCIPQDPIEDLEWFPSFTDDFISLGDLPLTPEHEALSFEDSSAMAEQENLSSSGAPATPMQKSEDGERVPFRECSSAVDNESHRIEGDGLLGFACVSKKKRTSMRPSRRAWSSKDSPFLSLSPENQDHGVRENKRMRCTHCQAEKTPQWRMGPMGPKTLCNACGVRYKSGRLLPEYRPAASPTFDSLKHSNFHKKILNQKSINWYESIC